MHHHSSNQSRQEQAITRIANLIKESPDTSGGVQLRKFLWSFFNMHHVVNLWTLASRLPDELSGPISEIVRAGLAGELTENDIKRGLLLSGEFSRWEKVRPESEALLLIEEACQGLYSALTKIPPCYEHTEITRLLRRLEELKESSAVAFQDNDSHQRH
jgi:hypothetical protein